MKTMWKGPLASTSLEVRALDRDEFSVRSSLTSSDP